MHNHHPNPNPQIRRDRDFDLPYTNTLAHSIPPSKIIHLISTHSAQPKDRPQVAVELHCFVLDHWHTRQAHWGSSLPAWHCSPAAEGREAEAGDASLGEVVVAVAVAAAGRMHAVLWLAGRSSVVLAEARSIADARAGTQDHRRRGCSLSLAGFVSAVDRSPGGSLQRNWVVGSPAYCMVSGGHFDIGVLLVG
jgi:hypothetical protein